MFKHSCLPIRAGLALIVLAAAVPAGAFTQYDYLFDPGAVRNDNQMFLNLTVTDSGVARVTLEPLLPRIRYVESDLPVMLFLARQSGRPVDAIVDMRYRGLSWARIFSDLGLRYDPLFADFDQDPGPRYRTAWTTWRTRPAALRLTDYQVRDLVQVQYGHRLASVPVLEVTRARARGRTPIVFVAERRGRHYTRLGVPPGHGGVPPGHGGVPPGQVKTSVPPGHRYAGRRGVVVVNQRPAARRVVVVKEKDKHDEGGEGKGNKGGGKGRGEGKGHKGGGKGKH
jgi:hypothetical protein